MVPLYGTSLGNLNSVYQESQMGILAQWDIVCGFYSLSLSLSHSVSLSLFVCVYISPIDVVILHIELGNNIK